MASREDEDRERRPPGRWEGEAQHASLATEPWRRESAHTSREAHPRGFAGEETHGGSYAGTAYGSGRWSEAATPAPSGYSGPSGTGYGQSCQGQSGYGHAEARPTAPETGVSYTGTSGYAGYAGARHTRVPTPAGTQDADRSRPDWLDTDYQQWRDEQMRKLDDDYQTWRQARYRKFADEFNAWRASRQDTTGATLSPTSPSPDTGSAAAVSSGHDSDGSAPADDASTPSSSQPQ